MASGESLPASSERAPEVKETPLNPNKCLITNKPSVKACACKLSSTSKLKQPALQENGLTGLVPSIASCSSLKPSPSSSLSALLPIPSRSVSRLSRGSFGKASELSPTPSESESSLSLKSSGNASRESITPSPSSSGSELLPIPSVSVSKLSLLSNGNAS